jgi:hypothetical protein
LKSTPGACVMAWQGTAMGLPRPANYMHPIQVLF